MEKKRFSPFWGILFLLLSCGLFVFIIFNTYNPNNKYITFYNLDPDAEPVEMQAKPQVITHFNPEHRASTRPVLTWTQVPGAVVYQLELFPRIKGAVQQQPFFTTREIYTNGYNVVIPAVYQGKSFAWHVRAIDRNGRPLSPYSSLETVYLDRKLTHLQRPIPTVIYNRGNGTTLLYPVYDWIAVNGAIQYEVEVLNAPPENPMGTEPSVHRIWAARVVGTEYYDEYPRFSPQPFYWRVLALDKNSQPLGSYSEARPFTANPEQHYKFATYGDSISHGGGGISYSPANWEYSYQSYLNFDSINLSRSGDTSADMVARFEEDVLPFHPEYLLIMGGSNSLRDTFSSASVIADLRTIQQKCLANGIKPILLTLPPINPDNIMKAFQEETVEDWRLKFKKVNTFIRTQPHIDLEKTIPDTEVLPTRLAVDGLHLDIAGKKLMAEAVNAQITTACQTADNLAQ